MGEKFPLIFIWCVWGGTGIEKIVIAEEANGTPLVGMELMLDYVAVIEAWKGGQVTLTQREFTL